MRWWPTRMFPLQELHVHGVLPKKYELNTTTLVPTNAPVTTQNFTGLPWIRRHLGQASDPHDVSQIPKRYRAAKITAPAGKFYVQNANFTNYQAMCEQYESHVQRGDSFDPTTCHGSQLHLALHDEPVDTRYGSPRVQVRQTDVHGRLTLRDRGESLVPQHHVYVDDQTPVARIRTNRTGSSARTA